MAPDYAPELNIVGVAFGGPPTDYKILQRSLNGDIGSGLYLAATAGLAREYPEMRELTNDNGRRVALLQKRTQVHVERAIVGVRVDYLFQWDLACSR